MIPCLVCGQPTRRETWTHAHTAKVVAVVDYCRACGSSSTAKERTA